MKFRSVLILILFGSIPLWAEEGIQVFNLDRCVELALTENAALKLERISLQEAELDRDARNSVFIPTLAVSSTISGSGKPVSGGNGTFSIGGGLSGSLSLNPGVSSTLRKMETAYQLAVVSYRGSETEVRSAVESRFYSLIAMEKNLEILTENLNLTQKQYERVKKAYSIGLAGELELLQAQLSLEKARQTLSQSTASYEASRRSFAVTLGLAPDTPYELSGEIAVDILDISDSSAYLRMLENHPDILTAALKVQSAEQTLQVTRWTQYGPTARLSAQWTGTEAFSADDGSFTDSGSLSLSVSVPLDAWIPKSSGAVTVTAAEDAVEKARINLETTRTKTVLSLLDALGSLEGDAESIRIAELQTSIAQRSYELAEEGYKRGTVEQLDLETARQDLMEARQNLLSARYNYLSALIDLRNILSAESISELYEGAAK